MPSKYDIAHRKRTLERLMAAIIAHENDIIEALHHDFRKPAFESVATETGYVMGVLRKTLKNLDRWARPEKVRSSLVNFRSSDYIYKEPYGKVLIIAPWNYPFQLAMVPLIAAIAAGNSVVVKPSELAPDTSVIVAKIIREVFEVEHAVAILGGPAVAEDLLRKRWDYIFFTGSTRVGKLVAAAAAQHLMPVTLELGGKNPCIVDESADLALTARRIAWGKFLNAGQTCIAPDYILAKSHIRRLLAHELKKVLLDMYTADPQQSPDFARIINLDHFERLSALIEPEKVTFGGIAKREDRYISPTLLLEDDLESPIMKDEIFGPLLPILEYDTDKDIDRILGRYGKPLALYVFTARKNFAREIIRRFSFGGGAINDTVIQFSNDRLPFGGVGASGMGAYHGKCSFDTFSHHKAVVFRRKWPDIDLRYPPYGKKIKLLRRALKWIS